MDQLENGREELIGLRALIRIKSNMKETLSKDRKESMESVVNEDNEIYSDPGVESVSSERKFRILRRRIRKGRRILEPDESESGMSFFDGKGKCTDNEGSCLDEVEDSFWNKKSE